jgi:hypothetical protein
MPPPATCDARASLPDMAQPIPLAQRASSYLSLLNAGQWYKTTPLRHRRQSTPLSSLLAHYSLQEQSLHPFALSIFDIAVAWSLQTALERGLPKHFALIVTVGVILVVIIVLECLVI